MLLILFIHFIAISGYGDLDLDHQELLSVIIQESSFVKNSFIIDPVWEFRLPGLGKIDINLTASYSHTIDITEMEAIVFKQQSFVFFPGMSLLFLDKTLVKKLLYIQSRIDAGYKIVLNKLNAELNTALTSDLVLLLFMEQDIDWVDYYLGLQLTLLPPNFESSFQPGITAKTTIKSLFYTKSIIVFRKDTPFWTFGYGINNSFITFTYRDSDIQLDSWVHLQIFFEYAVISGAPLLSILAKNRLFSYKSGTDENFSGYGLVLQGNFYLYPRWTYLGKQDRGIELGVSGEIELGPDTSWEIGPWKVVVYTKIEY